MRFLSLFKKELRECLPWLLLAMIIFLLFGGILLRNGIESSRRWGFWFSYPGEEVGLYMFDYGYHSPLSEVGQLLLVTSIGLGLVLGIRQFWIPAFTKTWAFTIHRSVTKKNILATKFIAAITAFVLSMGFTWTLFYLYISRPGLLVYPLRPQNYIEGWVFMIIGLIVYSGTALSGISRAKWYTTKIFSIIFAGVIIEFVFDQPNLFCGFLVILLGLLILLSGITHSFINRQF